VTSKLDRITDNYYKIDFLSFLSKKMLRKLGRSADSCWIISIFFFPFSVSRKFHRIVEVDNTLIPTRPYKILIKRGRESHSHSDRETQRHRDTETQRHRDTETQSQRDRETESVRIDINANNETDWLMEKHRCRGRKLWGQQTYWKYNVGLCKD